MAALGMPMVTQVMSENNADDVAVHTIEQISLTLGSP